jgi:hypothetical protein
VSDYWELVERQVEKTAAMLQESRANYSTIVLKEERAFACWCRTEDDALLLLMAAILLRTGRQDVERLVEAARQIDISQIDQIVEENLEEDEEEDEESGWQ